MSSKDNGFDKEQFAHLQKVVKKKITHTVSNLKRSFSKFANQILQKGPKKRDEYLFEWADDLPPEIIVNVLSFLDYQDLVRFLDERYQSNTNILTFSVIVP